MAEGGLFRSPTSRGLLGGALSGGVVLLMLLVDYQTLANVGLIQLVFVATSFLQLVLLIALPAYLATRRVGFSGALVFLLFLYACFVRIFPNWVITALSGSNVRHVFAAWFAFSVLLSGVLQGCVLKRSYEADVSQREAILWGLRATIPRMVLFLVSQFAFTQDVERRALFAMAVALCLAFQGAIAAVPFERALVREEPQ